MKNRISIFIYGPGLSCREEKKAVDGRSCFRVMGDAYAVYDSYFITSFIFKFR